MAWNAYYDPKTDIIYNCEKGSIIWFHENRHSQQYHLFNVWLNLTHVLGYSVGGAFIIASLIQTDTKFLYLVAFAWVPYTLTLILMEIDAWFYAIYKYVKNKIDRDFYNEN